MTDQSATTEFVRVGQLESVVEAQLVAAVLQDRGIAHRIQSFHDTAYDGLFVGQLGWGVVWASPEDAPAVEEILHDLRQEWQPDAH